MCDPSCLPGPGLVLGDLVTGLNTSGDSAAATEKAIEKADEYLKSSKASTSLTTSTGFNSTIVNTHTTTSETTVNPHTIGKSWKHNLWKSL